MLSWMLPPVPDSPIIWHDTRCDSWAHVDDKLIRICYYTPVWCWLYGACGFPAKSFGWAATREGAKATAMDAIMAGVEA